MTEHKSLSRDPSLAPFSRDHFYGLVQASALKQADAGDDEARRRVMAAFLEEWDLAMRDHFEQEERLLSALMLPEELARLNDEHTRLRSMVEQCKAIKRQEAVPDGFLPALGVLLHDHIRWEERELYEAIQARYSATERAALQRETDAMEASRNRDKPRTR